MSIFDGLFRSGWWPGPAANINKDRKMCSDCRYHRAASAGWQWDRCSHPEADYGSLIRNDTPLCHDMRKSSRQCGVEGKWFVSRIAVQKADTHVCPSWRIAR